MDEALATRLTDHQAWIASFGQEGARLGARLRADEFDFGSAALVGFDLSEAELPGAHGAGLTIATNLSSAGRVMRVH